MLGGFGLILGIAGLFGSAAAAGYTSNDIKDFNALGAYQRSISEPTPEEKAIYEKWRGKTFNQRHEAFQCLQGNITLIVPMPNVSGGSISSRMKKLRSTPTILTVSAACMIAL